MHVRLAAVSIWIILVTPSHQRTISQNFLTVNGHKEVLLASWTESAFLVKSRHVDTEEKKTYIVVSVEDPQLVQVVNITRSVPNMTHFMVWVRTGDPGETTFTVQLWHLHGNHRRLLDETGEMSLKVLSYPITTRLPETLGRINAVLVIVILPVILLNKCAFGCKVEVRTLLDLWRNHLPVMLGAAVQFAAMPFWGFALTQVLALPQALSFGFIMTCTCPGGGGGYMYALLLEGDLTMAISMTCISTALALVFMPLNCFVYSRLLGLSASLHIPFLKMIATLLSIAIPISAGIILKQRAPKAAAYLERVIRPLTSLIVVFGVYLGFQMGSRFLTGVHLDLFVIGLLIPAFGLLIGYFFSSRIFKLSFPVSKTVAIESGVQNAFLGLAIIQLSFPQAEADGMCVAPFLVALCSAGEMLLLVLLYNARMKITRLY